MTKRIRSENIRMASRLSAAAAQYQRRLRLLKTARRNRYDEHLH